MAHFKAELEHIFSTITPSPKFHKQLASLRQKMEKAFPALKGSPIERDKVPNDILKTYTLLLVAVLYDRNCTGQLNPKAITKARTVLSAVEEELKIDRNYHVLGEKLSSSDLHMYGYLLLLINNYDNDYKIAAPQTCIKRGKFITELFRQFFSTIDSIPATDIELLFNDDDDCVRLYILAKLSYADILLNAPQELRHQLGDNASLYEIKRIYSEQILQRFSDTRHLTATQIATIKSALEELDNKVVAGDKLAFLKTALNTAHPYASEMNARKVIALYQQQLGPIAVSDMRHTEFSHLYLRAHIILIDLACKNYDLDKARDIQSQLLIRCGCPVTANKLAAMTNAAITQIQMQQDELDNAAKILMSLKKTPEINQKRSREELTEPTLQGNRFRFTTNVNINVNIHITQHAEETTGKKSKSDENASFDF